MRSSSGSAVLRVAWLVGVTLLALGCRTPPSTTTPCAQADVAVQVLGSGGPIPDDARASAGYLVWVDGRARVLVDVGGGVFARFGRAGAKIEDLEVVALTHLHADHSADLVALLKGSFFSARTRELPIAGPSGSEAFPPLGEYLDRLIGPGGAYRYLSWLLDPESGGFSLRPTTVDASARAPQEIARTGQLRVMAIGVHHGPVPALGYRVDVGDRAIVFGGDQSGKNPDFSTFAQGATVLVMHHAVPEDARGVAANLHARPSEIATVARKANVGHLILSHHMKRSLDDLRGARRTIRSGFSGRVTVGEDLQCVEVR